MSSEPWQMMLSNRLLHLVLMPTEQCNFRCVYCYEDFSAGQMSRQVVDAVKALIGRRVSRLEVLSLEWFGGEPLLAWPIVQEIQGFVHDRIREHPEVRLFGTMNTNGFLLTRQRFESLLRLGVRTYQITLDGTPETHDTMRQRLGGGGSFSAIWRNLVALRQSPEDFRVLLRLHVTLDNQSVIDPLLVLLSHEFGGDHRFSVMFKAIRRFGGPNDAELRVLPPDQEGEVLGRLSTRAAELGLAERQVGSALPGRLPGCYAAALGSYVVRSTGELAKCTIALAHPNNRVGVLQPDGTVDLNSAKMTGWLRGTLSGDPKSVECPMEGWADEAQPRQVSLKSQQLVQIGGLQSAERRVPQYASRSGGSPIP